jgi:cytochrome oxidase Cu insertion factor (SCO1/SenC/PrrC family)
VRCTSLSRALALAAALATGLCTGAALAGVPAPGARLWSVAGDFVDDAGRHLTLDRLAGATTVVAMEYSACRFVCTVSWRKLTELQAEADRRGLKLRFVLISIDPANDTPALWREYRQARGLQRSNWLFLTGSRASTDAVARLLGVRWWLYDGNVMHDFRIVRLDEQGRITKAMLAYDLPAEQFLAD